MDLPLPGLIVHLEPGAEATVFEQTYADNEVDSALHRFAWIPLLGRRVDPAWVGALWKVWQERFAQPSDEGWAWEAYTAAERLCNIFDFARVHGLPEPVPQTLDTLAAHGAAILDRLEYGGEHNTSNHLANNGRGLFRLGLELGHSDLADLGARILLGEAKRLFLPSGMLREGSTHYHLVVLRFYADAWLAARGHGRAEATELERIVRGALAVVPSLVLSGGLPLIGDVSPDAPPEFFASLWNVASPSGWLALLPDDERMQLAALCGLDPGAPEALIHDGWLRCDRAGWSALWHVPPDGWPETPSHAHQDCGGFELHCGRDRLFIDSGRRRYGDEGDAAYGRSGQAHSILSVDGADPYPINKPYYRPEFRSAIAPPPQVTVTDTMVEIRHFGFQRMTGLRGATRRWRFGAAELCIDDAVDGRGTRSIERRFITPLPTTIDGDGVILRGRDGAWRVTAEVPLRPAATRIWPAYGVGMPATRIDAVTRAALPWKGAITIKRVSS
jgi:hypothetical protein